MFSCNQVAGGLARIQASLLLFFCLAHCTCHRQAGGAVGVGACRTVAAGSVSVPGAGLCPVLWTGSCLSVVCVGQVGGWVDPWDSSWDRAAFLWSERGGDLGPCCAGRSSLVGHAAGGTGVHGVREEHNVFVVTDVFHLVTRRGAVGGAQVGGWEGHVQPMGARCCCWWVGVGLRSVRGSWLWPGPSTHCPGGIVSASCVITFRGCIPKRNYRSGSACRGRTHSEARPGGWRHADGPAQHGWSAQQRSPGHAGSVRERGDTRHR